VETADSLGDGGGHRFESAVTESLRMDNRPLKPKRGFRRELAFLVLLHLLAGFTLLAPGYIRPDSVGTYAFLRSAVYDRDLLFLNEWAMFGLITEEGFAHFKEVTAIGTLANHWPIGTSILSLPFYLAAVAVERAGSSDSGGFFGLFATTLSWTTVLFSLLTGWIGLRLMHACCPTLEAGRRLAVVVAVLLGTPLFWYSFRFPLTSHVSGALAIAVLTWLLIRESELTPREAFSLGIVLGLAIATRVQHVILIPVVVFVVIGRGASVRAWVAGLAGGTLAFAPQMLAWWTIYGSPAGPLVSGATTTGATWMAFRTNSLGAALFSSFHGLFFWSPLTLLALAGWIFAALRRQRAATVVLLMFAAEAVANGFFDRYFWGGMSFGARRFVDLAVPYALGVAWFLLYAPRWMGMLAVSITTGWSTLLMAAALSGRLTLSRDVLPRDLVQLVMSSEIWRGMARERLHSAASQPELLAPVAGGLLIVVAVSFVLGWLARHREPARVSAVVALVLVILATAALHRPTRERARTEPARFGLDPTLARLGPLHDQRKLFEHEAEYYRNRGRIREAAAVSRDIAEVDATIEAMLYEARLRREGRPVRDEAVESAE
jgi:hypothetical protein